MRYVRYRTVRICGEESNYCERFSEPVVFQIGPSRFRCGVKIPRSGSPSGDITKEKRNVIGNYSIDHCGVDADRRDSDLATQQGMGLWTERRARTGIGHTYHSVAVGTIVIMAG